MVVTGAPRKRVVRKGTWVRIPPSPPQLIEIKPVVVYFQNSFPPSPMNYPHLEIALMQKSCSSFMLDRGGSLGKTLIEPLVAEAAVL